MRKDLPIRNRTVLVILPRGGPFSIVDLLRKGILVKLYTKTRSRGNIDVSVLDDERRFYVADAEIRIIGISRMLLNKEVRDAGIELQSGCEGDWTEGIMRSY